MNSSSTLSSPRVANSRFRSRRGGFTLLELILATAVGAIVLLVINATFFAALRLHNTTHDKIDQDLVLQRTLAIVRRDIEGLMLPPNAQATTITLAGQFVSDTGVATDADANGQRVSPDLYTNSARIDGWSQFADAQRVAYYLTPAADGGLTKNLVRVVTRNLLSVDEPITDDQTLITGLRSATMSFYDGTDWTDTWDSSATSTLPSAIKFTLVLEPPDLAANRAEPGPVEMIVPVVVMTTTSAQDAAAASTGQ
ncbi:MAG TPA: type II secretion system protein GspJ [Opitutaceae bacterium]|nr:type II secretion system protein GspJ [Opitutaceae bacterium]